MQLLAYQSLPCSFSPADWRALPASFSVQGGSESCSGQRDCWECPGKCFPDKRGQTHLASLFLSFCLETGMSVRHGKTAQQANSTSIIKATALYNFWIPQPIVGKPALGSSIPEPRACNFKGTSGFHRRKRSLEGEVQVVAQFLIFFLVNLIFLIWKVEAVISSSRGTSQSTEMMQKVLGT